MIQLSRDGLRDVSAVLRPRSIAIVGASPRPGATSARIRTNLRHFGYAGQVHLVNPNYTEVHGEPCHPSVAAIGAPVDHVVILVPAAGVPAALEEAGRAGAASAMVYAVGFAETGLDEGSERTEAIRDVLSRYDIRLCGPNTMGNIALEGGAVTFTAPGLKPEDAGSLSAISQSGGMVGALAQYATQRGVGLRYCIDSGNEIDLDLVDYLAFLVDDPGTRIIALYVESIRRPEVFRRLCADARRAGKTLVAIRAGRTPEGQAAARSHTAALNGRFEVFAALCRAEGIARVESIDEMVELVVLLQHLGTPRGWPAKPPAFLSISGALRALVLDAAHLNGLHLARFGPETARRIGEKLTPGSLLTNPLDMGWVGIAIGQEYRDVLDAVAADPEVGAVFLQEELPPSAAEQRRAGAYPELVAIARRHGKPVVFYSRASYNVEPYGRELQASLGVPFLQEAYRTTRAALEMQRVAASWAAGEGGAGGGQAAVRGLDLSVIRPGVPEADLRAAGIPLAEEVVSTREADWIDAFRRFGAPVAVKVALPGLAHKTERGGVFLSLTTEAAVREAGHTLQRRFGGDVSGGPSAVPVQVQPQLSGIEVLVAAGRDPEMGPFALVGWGGVMTEVLRDVAAFVPPVSAAEVAEAVGGLRVGALLRGFRGSPAADVDALASFAAALCNGAASLPAGIASVEFNPVLVLPAGRGLAVVDVAVEAAGS